MAMGPDESKTMMKQSQSRGKETQGPVLTLAMVRPWLMSCTLAVTIPFICLVLWQKVPELRSIMALGQEEVHGAPFVGNVPLQGASRTFTCATVLGYWATGLLLSFRHRVFIVKRGARTAIAAMLSALAVALLLFILPLLATVWAVALKMNAFPQTAWGVFDGNHGPWRYFYDLRQLLHFSFGLPVHGACAASISCLMRMSVVTLCVVLTNVAAFFALLYTHYWLID